MAPKELEEIGLDIWGEGWKKPMSRALNCDPKTIRNYLSGINTIPLEVAARVRDMRDPVAGTVTAAILKVKPSFPKRAAVSIGQVASADLAAMGLRPKREE